MSSTMSALMKDLIKSSNNPLVNQLTKSVLFTNKDTTKIRIPIFNVAFSGELNKGFQSGITIFAGPTKHFKTNMGLVCVASYQKKYEDAICIFFDSEHGSSEAYLRSMGVDPDRVIHVPVKTVEQLRTEMKQMLDQLKRGQKVILFVDSIGNLASKKESEDASNEKETVDMTRAKALKSLFRIVTPYMTELDIPCVMINHTIKTLEMFSKEVMTGGTGSNYAPDTIFFIGKRQVKDGTELAGYEFDLKTHKSRTLREGIKFPVLVRYDGGIDPYSGLIQVGMDTGFVVKPKAGWYSRVFEVDGVEKREEKSWRLKDTNSVEFWTPLFHHEPFRIAIRKKYVLGSVLADKNIGEEVETMMNGEVSKNVDVKFSDTVNNNDDQLEDELEQLQNPTE